MARVDWPVTQPIRGEESVGTLKVDVKAGVLPAETSIQDTGLRVVLTRGGVTPQGPQLRWLPAGANGASIQLPE